MKIIVEDTALDWFQQEIGLKKGDMVRFYPQIYGSSPVQDKFALGLAIDSLPIDMAVRSDRAGITFYVEDTDLWFFNGHDLTISYNLKKEELEFAYTAS